MSLGESVEYVLTSRFGQDLREVHCDRSCNEGKSALNTKSVSVSAYRSVLATAIT
jgi:hypothetical protein